MYSAILVDIEERNGVLSSMFSGYKNIRTDQTVEALGLVGEAPEEQARSSKAKGSDGATKGSNGHA